MCLFKESFFIPCMAILPSADNPQLQTATPTIQGNVMSDQYNQCIDKFQTDAKKDGKTIFWLLLGGLIGSIVFGIGGIIMLVGIIWLGIMVKKTGTYILRLIIPSVIAGVGAIIFFFVPSTVGLVIAIIAWAAGGVIGIYFLYRWFQAARDLKNGNFTPYQDWACEKFK